MRHGFRHGHALAAEQVRYRTATAVQGTAGGRPQPQTTGETGGGPFIRHAPPGRRPVYQSAATFGLFFGPQIVAAPGWYRGYRINITSTTGGGTGGVIAATAGGVDAPASIVTLMQLKDAWGTNLFTGPGYEMLELVQLISGQFGLEETRSIRGLPSWTGITAASGAFSFSTYFPFEFTTGYGVIAGANAALLPVLQMPIATVATLFSTPPTVSPTLTVTNDADFYWLPNAPTDPPGLGTTCQYVYQPCNPTIPTGGSLRVQLPRLGGYLTMLTLDLRDSTGLRIDSYPARPGLFVDSVELVNSRLDTITDDMGIMAGIGSFANNGSQTAPGTVGVARPTGIIAFSRKTSLAQRDFGLLDTGEKFLSTNPGTQIEVNGVPWGVIANTPATLNAVIGQIVPSGPLVQGLPEV
jgi:hypothetical protein